MIKKYFVPCIICVLITLSIQNCLKDNNKKTADIPLNGQNELNEKFHKTGWITKDQYRAVVYIITGTECEKSSQAEMNDKIKFEAYKHLQKELNSGFDRNTSIQIKILVDTYGKLIKPEKGCLESNTYFYDLQKNNLETEFEKIKNLK